MNIFDKINQSKTLYALLGVSLLFFLIKGLNYALIGSYTPILFIIIVMVLLYGSFGLKQKRHYKIITFWAILIIIWTVTRLGISIILKIDTTLTESHLREQFGFIQQLISIGMLGLGIGMIKQLKKERI